MAAPILPERVHCDLSPAGYLEALALLFEAVRRDVDTLRALALHEPASEFLDHLDDSLALTSWRSDLASKMCRSPWACDEGRDMLKRFM